MLDLETQLARYGEVLDELGRARVAPSAEVPVVDVAPHRSRVVALVAAAVVVALAVASFAIVRSSSSDKRSAPAGVPDVPGRPVTLGELAQGTWNDLPLGPIGERRDVLAAVWTGNEVLVSTQAQNATHADDFAFSPDTGRWREIAPAPITKRQSAVSVWTGSRWIIWGGSYLPPKGAQTVELPADGAMYDPATDTWSPIPDAPIGGRTDASSVWTGHEVVVAGGEHGCSPGVPCALGISPESTADGAAFDPSSATWRTISAAPNPVPSAEGSNARTVWDGEHAVFVGPAIGTLSQNDLAQSYDPATDTWSTEEFPHQAVSLAMQGPELLGVSAATPVPGDAGTTFDAVRRVSSTFPFAVAATPFTTPSACWVQVQTSVPGAMVFDCGENVRSRVDNQISTAGQPGSQVTLAPPGSETDSVQGFDAATGEWASLPGIRSDAKYLFWTDRGLLAIGLQWFSELRPAGTAPSTTAPANP